jgi:hypothetical protein
MADLSPGMAGGRVAWAGSAMPYAAAGSAPSAECQPFIHGDLACVDSDLGGLAGEEAEPEHTPA